MTRLNVCLNNRNIAFLLLILCLIAWSIVTNITAPTNSLLESLVTAQEYIRAQNHTIINATQYDASKRNETVMKIVVLPEKSKRESSKRNETVMKTVAFPKKALKRFKRRTNRKHVQQNFTRDDYWTNINKNKVIIFLHFHKAGGSSIVDAARSVLYLWEPNGNANPKRFLNGKSGKAELIPFWEYDTSRMASFITSLLPEIKVSFIAFENQYFHNNLINTPDFKRNHNIEMITQLRDPFHRFVSNFFYELLLRRYTEKRGMKSANIVERLKSFHNDTIESHSRLFGCSSSWNMYTRILSLKWNEKDVITHTDLIAAKRELDKFEVITILEKQETFKILQVKYGMKRYNSQHNIKKRISEMDTALLMEFEKEFKILNQYDYMLYDYATNKSLHLLRMICNNNALC